MAAGTGENHQSTCFDMPFGVDTTDGYSQDKYLADVILFSGT